MTKLQAAYLGLGALDSIGARAHVPSGASCAIRPCVDPRIARTTKEVADALSAAGRALDLDDAIAFALSGPKVPTSTEPARAASPLAAREQEVARLLARGFSNRQIADELVISLHTAQRHVENILSKLALSSRTQVAAWAIGEGLTAEVPRP